MEQIPGVSPENEEKPEVYSVVIDGQLTQFNRRSFLEKAAVAGAAATVLAAGCTPKAPIDLQATVDAAILETQNAAEIDRLAEADPPTLVPKKPTSTPTKTATKTPVPPTATITASPTPPGIKSSVSGDKVNFRSGPGTGYAPITQLVRGDEILLTGRLGDNSWVAVGLSNPNKPGTMVNGWIKTNLVAIAGLDMQNLPVITNIPPTPTPLPGHYGFTKSGQKGIDYSYTDEFGNVYTMTMACGGTVPRGAVCTCDCITVPRNCSCVDHTSAPCSCNTIHYWYPN